MSELLELLGLVESMVLGVVLDGVVVVLGMSAGAVVAGWPLIDGCWSLGVVVVGWVVLGVVLGVVVCAMLTPAAATNATTAAMLNVLDAFLMSLTPLPVWFK